MINVERLAQLVAKTGAKNVLIHTIPGTRDWIVCQKIGKDEWMLTLMDPEKSVTFNLGSVNNKQHMQLWRQLVNYELEKKAKAIATFRRAELLRGVVHNFINLTERNCGNIIKNKAQGANQISPRAKASSKGRPLQVRNKPKVRH
jgi:hypothetical protein